MTIVFTIKNHEVEYLGNKVPAYDQNNEKFKAHTWAYAIKPNEPLDRKSAIPNYAYYVLDSSVVDKVDDPFEFCLLRLMEVIP